MTQGAQFLGRSCYCVNVISTLATITDKPDPNEEGHQFF